MNIVPKKFRAWHLGAQNDGLFIIDMPPRPSTDDMVHEHREGISPDLAIPIWQLPKDKAQLIVDAHNSLAEIALDAVQILEKVWGDPEVSAELWTEIAALFETLGLER